MPDEVGRFGPQTGELARSLEHGDKRSWTKPLLIWLLSSMCCQEDATRLRWSVKGWLVSPAPGDTNHPVLQQPGDRWGQKTRQRVNSLFSVSPASLRS